MAERSNLLTSKSVAPESLQALGGWRPDQLVTWNAELDFFALRLARACEAEARALMYDRLVEMRLEAATQKLWVLSAFHTASASGGLDVVAKYEELEGRMEAISSLFQHGSMPIER